MAPNSPKAPGYLLLPMAGVLLAAVFYLVAATTYTGGSWVEPGADTFSFRYNYFCDLLDTRGVDGTINNARHWARAALGILCVSLAVLWYQLPNMLPARGWQTRLLRYSGILALCIPLFLRPGMHDAVLHLAGVVGAVALLSLIGALYRAGHTMLGTLGILCLLLLALNYTFYESGSFLKELPLLQKATFGAFLAWFGLLNRQVYVLHKPGGASP